MTEEKDTVEYHIDRLHQLEVLLEKAKLALLGEDTEMRYELERVKRLVIEEIKLEQQTISILGAEFLANK